MPLLMNGTECGARAAGRRVALKGERDWRVPCGVRFVGVAAGVVWMRRRCRAFFVGYT